MAARWFVNIIFLLFPIVVTLGVLFGIKADREASGQPPLFVDIDNGVTTSRYCQKSFGISSPSVGQGYTLNPNQWGWTEGDPGSLCMNVTTFNNKTYATPITAPEFSVSWQFPQGPESEPVHAFPNIQPDSPLLPIPLGGLKTINLNVGWSYGVGDKTTSSTNATSLTNELVNANVALDMFLDHDKANAQNTTAAKYEVMVWFAHFGSATQPLGHDQGVAAVTTINGTTFSLYLGQNSQGQRISTWVASETTSRFSGDLGPLVTNLSSPGDTNAPTSLDYLGYISFGSEAFSSNSTVTFSVPNLSIDIEAS